MTRWIRIALQVAIFFLLLGAVMGLGSGDTGAVEKVVLAVGVIGLVWLAVLVRRIDGPRSA
jgi:hypothetical protein